MRIDQRAFILTPDLVYNRQVQHTIKSIAALIQSASRDTAAARPCIAAVSLHARAAATKRTACKANSSPDQSYRITALTAGAKGRRAAVAGA